MRPTEKLNAAVEVSDGVRDILSEDEREISGVPLHLGPQGCPILIGEGECRDPEADDQRRAEADH